MKTTIKCIALVLISSIFIFTNTFAQEEAKDEFKPSGKAHGQVYFNWHYDMTDHVYTSNFQVMRSYFGYKYKFSEDFSTKITLDMDYKADDGQYTFYLKHAQLDWKVCSPFKLSLGLIGYQLYNDQENHWGYRYLYKSFMDEHEFGTTADLGFNAHIKLHDMVQINAGLVNGEGYKKLQDGFGIHKVHANLIFKPVEGLMIKAHYDMMPESGTPSGPDYTQSTIAAFIGYIYKETFRIGAEYNIQNNHGNDSLRNLSGISAYAAYNINKKIGVFLRFDMLQSSGYEDDTTNKSDHTKTNQN